MSDDDLDNFFVEVEEVVEEVKKEVEKADEGSTVPTSSAVGEGEESQSATVRKDYDEDEEGPPPSKRIRSEATISVPSRGAVIVSKAAARISSPPTSFQNKATQQSGEVYQITVPQECLNPPAPPPPPPAPPAPPPQPPNYHYNNGHPHSLQQYNAHHPQEPHATSKPSVRVAAGKKWTDSTLSDFPENDYRLFVGNLDKIITEQKLAEAFQAKYSSFAMCRIIYDKISGTSKGYGFVSLMDPKDCARAIREMDQSWLGSRPIKVKRSDWKERDLREVRKERNKKKKGARSRRR